MSEIGIPEAASKKKRGRPKAWGEVVMAISQSCVPNVRTRRHLQNVSYREFAIGCLVDDPQFAWLCDGRKMQSGEPGAWQPGILAELGRFLDKETIKAYATRICELQPKTKDAIVMLRRARTGKSPEASCLALTAAIERTINRYIAAHPDTTWRQVLTALENVRDEIEEAAKAED